MPDSTCFDLCESAGYLAGDVGVAEIEVSEFSEVDDGRRNRSDEVGSVGEIEKA
jgi:hypothetical protein